MNSGPDTLHPPCGLPALENRIGSQCLLRPCNAPRVCMAGRHWSVELLQMRPESTGLPINAADRSTQQFSKLRHCGRLQATGMAIMQVCAERGQCH